MQVINDTEVFEPNECLFAIGAGDPDNPEYLTIVITDKKYWDENKCLNDCFGDHSLTDGAIPGDIWEMMEATWDTELPFNVARDRMIKAGFIESPEMASYIFSEE